MRVALPQGTTTNAIGLGPMDRVHLGSHRGSTSTFVVMSINAGTATPPPPPSSKPWTTQLTTDLKDVEVTRGTDLDVDLDGQVKVVSAAKTDVSGQIHLKEGGKLSVQGKDFVIVSGIVTLVGADPSNPQIVVKAGYTAADGTVVYANFVGPLKTGKVTLSSEPALPQEEIVQLLLFGSADGQQAQNPSADPTVSALSTVGGEVAQPLNHMFNQLGMSAVTVKVDTKDSATPKPEVEVRDRPRHLPADRGRARRPSAGRQPRHDTPDGRLALRQQMVAGGNAGRRRHDRLRRLVAKALLSGRRHRTGGYGTSGPGSPGFGRSSGFGASGGGSLGVAGCCGMAGCGGCGSMGRWRGCVMAGAETQRPCVLTRALRGAGGTHDAEEAGARP